MRVIGRDNKGLRKVDSVVEDVLEESGVLQQVKRIAVLEEWPELVGESVAKVTRARSLDRSTLVVEVRSSAWLMELDMMKKDLLARVNAGREEFPIERIVLVLAPSG